MELSFPVGLPPKLSSKINFPRVRFPSSDLDHKFVNGRILPGSMGVFSEAEIRGFPSLERMEDHDSFLMICA